MADNSHTNNFLKNLSQKKYAWMEEAAATPLPPKIMSEPRTLQAAKEQIRKYAQERPAKKNKKIKLSSPDEDLSAVPPPKQHKFNHKKPSSTTSSTSSTSSSSALHHKPPMPIKVDQKVNTREETVQLEHTEEHTPIDLPVNLNQPKQTENIPQKHPQPRFKYTTFPVKGYSILPTRNISSNFARTDITYFPGCKAGSEEIAPDPEEDWRDTIIIHPGSRNLRINFASEAFPRTIPHVIARRFHSLPPKKPLEIDECSSDDEGRYEEALHDIKGELKWRMKNAKRRAVPNAEGQVLGFNSSAFKEMIPDHNDPYKVEWTEVDKTNKPEYFVGEKALNLPISKDSEYRVFYPWKHGTLNNQDYDSINQVLGDIEAIWTETIVNELEVDRTEFKDYNVVLVIPDMFNHSYLCELMTVLLRFMNFRGVIVQQESVCATYGAGVSSAVVVDIGAQKTSIACIEEGVCQVDSRMTIATGGDDITRTFASMLIKNKFPYTDIDLSTTYDWRLAEELKEKWCTMNEADISVQVYDFYTRTPFRNTIKYQCKVYDEVFLAPLCLIYPGVISVKEKEKDKKRWSSDDVVDDIIEDIGSNSLTSLNTFQQTFQRSRMDGDLSLGYGTIQHTPNTKRNRFTVYPLDAAIAQSITTAANGSEEKLKRYFTSIILVGGGGKISNFSKLLEDRVLSTILAQKASIERVEVVPAPRELDPELLVWKGATVMSKLDTAKDMWIGVKEWEEVGSRCLRERALLL
ncbi:hypothetical protein BDB01DRAFT_778238 [Pilobolus umbonatus]|nr:hypothetical protein BDB01DRAFT_778238 [Pilobolus umbonatus]